MLPLKARQRGCVALLKPYFVKKSNHLKFFFSSLMMDSPCVTSKCKQTLKLAQEGLSLFRAAQEISFVCLSCVLPTEIKKKHYHRHYEQPELRKEDSV